MPVDTPDVNGSDIYITQPIHAVPGAALLLDASNNSGAIAHWVNLGTAGGSLLASDRLPTVEEGEIEIPGYRIQRSTQILHRCGGTSNLWRACPHKSPTLLGRLDA